MRLDDFYYELPKKLIAHVPAPERDRSRLMVVHRKRGQIEHRFFYHLDEYFRPSDILVVNNTKVRPARLFGQKETGGRVEVLLLEPLSLASPGANDEVWEVLIHARKKPRLGTWIMFSPQLKACVLRRKENGLWNIRLEANGNTVDEIVQDIGHTPLPPYIKPASPDREDQDRQRYQTIFAQRTGSAAAPTAGLHFTDQLINRIKNKGVEVLTVTLHVGLGTFQPVRVQSVENHRMHREYYEVSPETAALIRGAFEAQRRVVACGTTSVRVVETIKNEAAALRGYTDLFIYPGYRFKIIEGMVTNFHLPCSTLLILVAALAGRDLILRAYKEAIDQEYRFYSYGDAMLIL